MVTADGYESKIVIELSEATKPDLPADLLRQADIVTWDGSIGAFAGLIAASDQYIGYDSAGQHIAAALGVKTLTVFVSSNNATFTERWRPFGKGKVEVVNVEVNHRLRVAKAGMKPEKSREVGNNNHKTFPE